MLRRLQPGDEEIPSINLPLRLHNGLVGAQRLVIGRGDDADIVLNSQRAPLLVSRRHAVLTLGASGLQLEDLKSLNGTFINDVRLGVTEAKVLREGDVLSFGGGKLMRQAGSTVDEENPFVFKLTNLSLLTSTPSLPGQQREQISQHQGPPAAAAQEVVDLTGDDSPVLSAAPPLARRPPPPPPTRKQRRAAPCIDLTVLDSDEEPSLAPSRPVAPTPKARRTSGTPLPPQIPMPPAAGAPESPGAPAAAAASAAVLKALEGQFECNICREFMVAAHSLVPCGHMFCGACVGEWLDKHDNCPSCRTQVTAAPVPSRGVDNMLDEVVVQHLDADAKQERLSRKSSWAKEGKAIEARLKARFGGNRGPAVGGVQPGILPHLAAHHFTVMGLPHFVEAMAMNAAYGSPNRSTRRYRRSVMPPSRAAQPPQPPPRIPSNFQFQNPRRSQGPGACSACGNPMIQGQPCITAAAGGSRHVYHTACAGRVPEFMSAWRSSGGALPGTQLLPHMELARLQSFLQPRYHYGASSRPAS